ncbi:unnamed protein product [Parajaminaea phylloscopi]
MDARTDFSHLLRAWWTSFVSLAVPVTFLPALPAVFAFDVALFLLSHIYAELCGAVRRANRFWGWAPLDLLKGIVGLRQPDLKRPTSKIERPLLLRHALVAFSALPTVGSLRAPSFWSRMGQSQQPAEGHQNPCQLTCPSPLADLPNEIVHHILVYLLHTPTTSAPGYFNCLPLLLSSTHRATFEEILYSRVHLLHTRQFRLLRETLALHRPALGKLVKSLVVASTAFDSTGYVAEPIAHNHSIAVGLEQFMIDMPHLGSLALDLYSLAALTDINTNQRFDSAPRIKSLKTELAFAQYLDVPIFEDLEDLEIVCFGLDKHLSEQLRTVLPRLRRLTIRLVTRSCQSMSDRSLRKMGAAPHPYFVGSYDTGDSEDESGDLSRCDERWSDTTPGRIDADAFVEALNVLRSWPHGDRSAGTRLESLTVLAWPAAVIELHERCGLGRLPEDSSTYEASVRPHRLKGQWTTTGTSAVGMSRSGSQSPDARSTSPVPLVVQKPSDLLVAVKAQSTEIAYLARHHLTGGQSARSRPSLSWISRASSDTSDALELAGPLPNLAGGHYASSSSSLSAAGSSLGTHSASDSASADLPGPVSRFLGEDRTTARSEASGGSTTRSTSRSTATDTATAERNRAAYMAALSETPLDLPLAPLRIDLDPYRDQGPRKGSVQAWIAST